MGYKDESQHRKWLRHRHWSVMNNNAVVLQFREKLGSYISYWEKINQYINPDRKLAWDKIRTVRHIGYTVLEVFARSTTLYGHECFL